MKKILADETVEKLLIQKIFTDDNYKNLILNNYDERHFKNKNAGFIINAVKEFNEKYKKLPDGSVLKMIFEKETNTKELLTLFKGCMNLEVQDQDDFVRDAIVGYIQNKRMYYAIMDNLDEITERGQIDSVIKEFQDIAQVDIVNDLGLDFFKDHDKHMDEVCNPEAVIPTMYEHLDKCLNGGMLQNGKALYVVMAQAGLAKSLFLSNLAVNFLMQGKTVAVISLEMSELVYGKRIDAHISGQDVNALDIHRETVSEKIKDFKELYDSTLFIKDFPPNSINTHKIEAYLTKLKTKIGKNIDIIIVDYINLLRPNEKTDGGMYERVGEVSRDLRALSYKFEAPVISPTQSNREGWDTSDVAMSNVSESAGIAHTADF